MQNKIFFKILYYVFKEMETQFKQRELLLAYKPKIICSYTVKWSNNRSFNFFSSQN